MRAPMLAAAALLATSACNDSQPGTPARLVAGNSDTVVVNNQRPVQIPVRVLDARGHILPDTGVRFEWTSGTSIPISVNGTVTCTQSGDASVRVSLGTLTTNMLLRCRPVRSLHISGPVQLRLGDAPQELQIEALGLDGRPVDLLAGTADIIDSSVAAFDGLRVRPRSPGAALAGVTVGEQSAGVGVHVFEKVTSLDNLRPEQTYIALSVRMQSAELRRWHLPAGVWMMTMLPYEDENRGLRLRIEGANCTPATLTKRRYVCLVKSDASVIVYHPSRESSAAELSGELLVRRIEDR
jgi:hypothetical protein